MNFSDCINLSPELEAIAFSEFGETNELRDSSLIELRQRIQALPDVSDRLVDSSDRSLIRFLRSRKFDIEKAFESTVELQKFNNKYNEFVTNITYDHLRYISHFLSVIREPLPSGRIILILRPIEAIKYFTEERRKKYPKLTIMVHIWIHQQISFDPNAQICGLVIVNNFDGLTFWNQINLSKMASVSDQIIIYQHFQIIGTRFKGTFLLNQPQFLSLIWFMVKSFVSEKIKSRVFFCGSDYSLMQKMIGEQNISLLPKSLGGELEDNNPCVSEWGNNLISLLQE